jgi:PIN domain nuclease of toxin-antitoxin system
MILLDTHILLWWYGDRRKLSRRVLRLLERAGSTAPAIVSCISLWETATLYEQERIKLRMPVRDWLEGVGADSRFRVESITPAVAAAVAAIPYWFHRDPADRILVATATVLGVKLVTFDERIRESGLVPVVD